ncbi:hypothetical protein ACLOJK_025658, partial [Asimina triloba]
RRVSISVVQELCSVDVGSAGVSVPNHEAIVVSQRHVTASINQDSGASPIDRVKPQVNEQLEEMRKSVSDSTEREDLLSEELLLGVEASGTCNENFLLYESHLRSNG